MTIKSQQSRIKQPISVVSGQSLYKQQKGMALLTILLLVVAITIVAGSMLANQKVMIREFELTKGQGQFKEYALAGESFATNLIAQDSQINQVDSLKDSWANTIPTQTYNQAKVTIKIDDDASRFNINNLYHDGKVDETALAFFKALLQANGLSPNIALAVLDWQDPDSETRKDGGAEADYYQSIGKKMTMNIGNQPFVSVNELQYVRGMDGDGFKKIEPYITAVPFYLPMNVNTVKPQLLRVLLNLPNFAQNNANDTQSSSATANNASSSSPMPVTNQMDDIAIENWANARINNLPVQNLTELWTIPIFAKVDSTKQNIIGKLLDTQSRSFEVSVTVKSEEKQLLMRSRIAKIFPQAQSAQPIASGLSAMSPINTQNNMPPQIIAYNRQFLPLSE